MDETLYFKPETGRLIASPADETPSPPCDAQPEELDVAIVVDRLETATTLEIARIENSWAGLRSFVEDKSLVVGADDAADGFYWLAAQGGYGIQTAPSVARAIAGLVIDGDLPSDLRDRAFDPFTRGDPARNTRSGTAGLGLAIARDIVVAHGGSIAIVDRPGGAVEVRLPRTSTGG